MEIHLPYADPVARWGLLWEHMSKSARLSCLLLFSCYAVWCLGRVDFGPFDFCFLLFSSIVLSTVTSIVCLSVVLLKPSFALSQQGQSIAGDQQPCIAHSRTPAPSKPASSKTKRPRVSHAFKTTSATSSATHDLVPSRIHPKHHQLVRNTTNHT